MTGFSQLLDAAKHGDDAARSEMYARYVPMVVGRLRRRARGGLRRTHDTVDLAQSVFVEVLRDLPRFEDRGEAAFRSWLAIKSDNKVRMKFRKQLDRAGQRREIALEEQRDATRDEPVRAPGPHTSIRMEEDGAHLEAALRTLRPSEQMIIRLRRDDDVSYGALAELLGLASADAARKRHARALLSLRKAWTHDRE